MLRRTGAVGGLASLLVGSLNLLETDDTLVTVRFDDDTLLAPWPSEEDEDESKPPECVFYNGSVTYESSLCSHFVIARSAAAPKQAFVRAMRCATHFDSACVLSAEIGLAVPAAFLVRASSVDMVMAPKLLPADQGAEQQQQRQQHVRVRVHDPTTSFASRTYVFNRTVKSEFMDGTSKSLRTATFEGNDAYCVQLLRRSFSKTCWDALD